MYMYFKSILVVSSIQLYQNISSVLPNGAIIAWVPTEDTPLPRGWLPCDGKRIVKEGPWQGQKTHNLTFPNTFGVFGSKQNRLDEESGDTGQAHNFCCRKG